MMAVAAALALDWRLKRLAYGHGGHMALIAY
jgi:hypothetical protein